MHRATTLTVSYTHLSDVESIISKRGAHHKVRTIGRLRLFYDKCKKQLDETYNYADSKEYGSWEQYYTDLLIELTRNTPAAYTKSNLNEFYLGDNSIKAIKEIYDCIDEGLANMSLF